MLFRYLLILTVVGVHCSVSRAEVPNYADWNAKLNSENEISPLQQKLETLSTVAKQLEDNWQSIQSCDFTFRSSEALFFAGKPSASHEILTPHASNAVRQLIADLPTSTISPGYWEVGSYRVRVSYAAEESKTFVRRTPDGGIRYVLAGNGTELAGPNGDERLFLSTQEEFYKFGSDIKLGQIEGFAKVPFITRTKGRVLFRLPPEKSMMHSFLSIKDIFGDGNSFFSQIFGGLERFPEDADKNISLYSVEQDFVCVVALSNGKRMLCHFDGKNGYNVKEYTIFTKEGTAQNQQLFSYVREGSSFVPEKIRASNFTSGPDQTTYPVLVQDMELLDVRLGGLEPGCILSKEAFPLEYAERYIDEVANELLIFNGQAGFVPVDDFVFEHLD